MFRVDGGILASLNSISLDCLGTRYTGWGKISSIHSMALVITRVRVGLGGLSNHAYRPYNPCSNPSYPHV